MRLLKANVAARWFGFALGLLTFVAVHSLEALMWVPWFGGVHDPWFLNSGRAAAFTMGSLFAVGLIGGALRVSGLGIAAGAAAAMAVVLMWGGGGSIFPIVLVAGGLLILVSSTLGAWIGKELINLTVTRR